MMNFTNKNVSQGKEQETTKEVDQQKYQELPIDLDELEFEKHKAGIFHTFLNIVKLFLGISILAGPHSYHQSGIIGGVVGLSIAGLLISYTVKMQTEACIKVNTKLRSYSELSRAVFGRGFKLTVDAFIMVVQVGLGISYLLFTGTQIDQLVCIATDNKLCGNKVSFIWLAVFIVLPMGMIKHMKHLAYVALVFLVGMIITYCTIIYSSVSIIVQGEGHHDEVSMFDLVGYPYFFGIAILNFEGNPSSLNIRASMKDSTHFNKVFLFSTIVVIIFSAMVAIFGYIAFGEQTQDIVLLNLPNNAMTVFVRVLY